MKCEDCLFWMRGTKQGTWDSEKKEYPTVSASWGDCRRYAPRGPVVVPETLQAVDAFPTTNEAAWCGEYAPRND